jgi:hypothetical protein
MWRDVKPVQNPPERIYMASWVRDSAGSILKAGQDAELMQVIREGSLSHCNPRSPESPLIECKQADVWRNLGFGLN